MSAPGRTAREGGWRGAAEAVRVVAPARLHLGFLDLHGGLGRKFGSVGITLAEPRTELILRPAGRISASGPSADRAAALAQKLIEGLQLRSAVAIETIEAIPEHAGLGSGTQLALAVGAGILRCAGLEPDPRRVADLAERGARSGIGIGAFAEGGVIVDGGRAKQSGAPPPVVSRLPFPEDWRILLLMDPRGGGLHGASENEAFKRLPPFPASLAGELCRLVLMQALPALAETDLPRFGAAVTELQRRIGDHFAPAQGGRFASPRVASALAWLERAGLAGLGQSSWGPTGFALIENEADGRALMAEAERRWAGSLSLRLVRGQNHGAEIAPLRQVLGAAQAE